MTLYIGQALLVQGWTTKAYTIAVLANDASEALSRLRADAMAQCGDGWRLDASEVHPVPTKPRWTLADGTEVGIGDEVWEPGPTKPRSYRLVDVAAIDGMLLLRRENYACRQSPSWLYGSRASALKQQLALSEERYAQLKGELSDLSDAIHFLKAELRKEREVSR